MNKMRSIWMLALLVLLSACTQVTETIPTTEPPSPSPANTPVPTPTLPPFNIEDYQPPEEAEEVTFKVRQEASVTLEELSAVMPWYSQEPYPNQEVLRAALENQQFRIEENELITGFGRLYVQPTPEFIEYFREYFELTDEVPVIHLGKQVTPARFEKYQPTWKEELPFETYVIPQQIRLIIPDQRTLDSNLLVIDMDSETDISIFIDGKKIEK